jgi:chemotaxis response regulator CheB
LGAVGELTVESGFDLASESAPVIPNALFPNVGVGVSAGGLRALANLLREAPAELSMAFVVVTHLAPSRQSHDAAGRGRHPPKST